MDNDEAAQLKPGPRVDTYSAGQAQEIARPEFSAYAWTARHYDRNRPRVQITNAVIEAPLGTYMHMPEAWLVLEDVEDVKSLCDALTKFLAAAAVGSHDMRG